MNIFQLFIANPAQLTQQQQALQKAAHAFVITTLVAILEEGIILLQQKPILDWPTALVLLGTVALTTGGHAVVPFLLQSGVDQATVTVIEQGIEDVAAALKKDQEK
jgi:hypothetical protein